MNNIFNTWKVNESWLTFGWASWAADATSFAFNFEENYLHVLMHVPKTSAFVAKIAWSTFWLPLIVLLIYKVSNAYKSTMEARLHIFIINSSLKFNNRIIAWDDKLFKSTRLTTNHLGSRWPCMSPYRFPMWGTLVIYFYWWWCDMNKHWELQITNQVRPQHTH